MAKDNKNEFLLSGKTNRLELEKMHKNDDLAKQIEPQYLALQEYCQILFYYIVYKF